MEVPTSPIVRPPATADGMKGVTMQFAEYVADLQFEDLPGEVLLKGKQLLRDGIGNQIAASAISDPAAAVVELFSVWGGKPESTVVGYGVRLPAPHTALCNAMLGHGVELDDAHGAGLIKAGSVLTPSLFAVAELTGASGRDLLTAAVGGYDVAIRIAKAINPGHRHRGYHTSGTVSVFGSAAASAKLLGCDAEQIGWALGLAGMQSAGIQAFLDDPCMAKPFSPGKAAFNGVLAAVMASRGFSGPKLVLESTEGFLNAFAPSVRTEDLLDGLGDSYAVMEVGFKPHAACRYAHGPLDIAQSFYEDDGVRLQDLGRVTVHMSELAIRQASKVPCPNLNVAMGSTQFGVALAFALGRNGLREYWEGFKMDVVHRAAVEKVELVKEPEFGSSGRQAIVEIRTRDGRTLQRRKEEPRGERTNPLTSAELKEKFESMGDMVLDEDTVREIGRRVLTLEEEPNAGVFPGLTRVGRGGRPPLRDA